MLLDEAPPLTVVYTACAALVGAIVTLFRMIITKNQELQQLSMRVGKLEGRQQGIESLSKQVLETVHKAVVEKEAGKPAAG